MDCMDSRWSPFGAISAEPIWLESKPNRNDKPDFFDWLEETTDLKLFQGEFDDLSVISLNHGDDDVDKLPPPTSYSNSETINIPPEFDEINGDISGCGDEIMDLPEDFDPESILMEMFSDESNGEGEQEEDLATLSGADLRELKLYTGITNEMEMSPDTSSISAPSPASSDISSSSSSSMGSSKDEDWFVKSRRGRPKKALAKTNVEDILIPKRRGAVGPRVRRSKDELKARKKTQNKVASGRYRMKLKLEEDILEKEVEELTHENISLKSSLVAAENEVKYLVNLISEIFRQRKLALS